MQGAEKNTKIVSLITKMQSTSEMDVGVLKHSLVRLMLAGGQALGFWSGEIIPPLGSNKMDWRLLLRFDSVENANAWRQSTERLKLLLELSTDSNRQILVTEEFTDADGSHGTVATSIVTDVKPGMEKDFFAWQYRIQTAQAKYDGYRGVYWQPPSPGYPHKWTILLRFDSPENLEKWFNSKERRQLVAEQDELVDQLKIQRVFSSYPGWFPLDVDTGQPPQKWKTALLILSALFPIVITEIRFLNPVLIGLNPALILFINLVGSVVLTTWVTLPSLIYIFKWWLSPDKSNARSIEAKGILLLFLLYLIELALFWQFLPSVQTN